MTPSECCFELKLSVVVSQSFGGPETGNSKLLRFASRTLRVIGIPFVIQLLQSSLRSVVAVNGLAAQQVTEAAQRRFFRLLAHFAHQARLLRRRQLEKWAPQLLRALLQCLQSGAGDGLRIASFEFHYMRFAVVSHSQGSVQRIEPPRRLALLGSTVEAQVQPLGGFRQRALIHL